VKLLDKGTQIIRSLQVVQTLCTFYRRYQDSAEYLTVEKRFVECRKLVMGVLDLKSFSQGEAIRSKRSLSHDRLSTYKYRRTEITVFPA